MKKGSLAALPLCLVLALTACGPRSEEAVSRRTAPENETGAPETAPEAGVPETAPETAAVPAGEDNIAEQICFAELELRIVDGAETGKLVLAGEAVDEVRTLDVGDLPVYLDGERADASVLEDGMMVTLGVYETSPSDGSLTVPDHICADSLGTDGNPGGGCYDLCGLYLQVLEDLWEVDAGLNGGISYISVDLSQAPGTLTDGEKAAIAQIFAEAHGAEGLTLTRAQLEEQGYLDPYSAASDGQETPYRWWEDGLLFTIEPHAEDQEAAYSLPVLRFDASKWRSPLGAYFFSDCTAVWPEMGAWDGYTVGAEIIS